MGSIPFSYLMGKLKGVDLLEVGSKNAGATNVYRSLGLPPAIICFLLDGAKGYGAMFLAGLFLTPDPKLIIMAGLFSILGHTFTPFLKFKGGKGVATGLGVLVYIQPIVALIGFIVAVVIMLSTRYVSLASMVSGITMVVLLRLSYFNVDSDYQIFVAVIVVFIIVKHIPNIKRLLKGSENKI